jgi:hypothetical protein
VTDSPEDQVSAKTAAALRAAMARLFEGRPQRTDGRLTKENLYKEAQVSRRGRRCTRPTRRG